MINFIKTLFNNIFKRAVIFFSIDTFSDIEKLKNKRLILTKKFLIKNIDGTNINIRPKVRWEFGNNIYLGDNIFINYGTYFDDHEKIEIGNNTWIGHYVKFITATHNPKNMKKIFLPIKVGDFCWIGTGAIILPGVEIGEGCIIGAGAVVNKSIPPFSIAVGNPANVIKKRKITFPYLVTNNIYIKDKNGGKENIF